MKAFRIAISYLLVFCMAVSCASAAFADSPAHIEVPPDDSEQTLGDLSTNATVSTALYVCADEGNSATVSAGTATATTADDDAYGVITQAMDEVCR